MVEGWPGWMGLGTTWSSGRLSLPMRGGGVETRWSLRSFSTQTILWLMLWGLHLEEFGVHERYLLVNLVCFSYLKVLFPHCLLPFPWSPAPNLGTQRVFARFDMAALSHVGCPQHWAQAGWAQVIVSETLVITGMSSLGHGKPRDVLRPNCVRSVPSLWPTISGESHIYKATVVRKYLSPPLSLSSWSVGAIWSILNNLLLLNFPENVSF